MKTALTITIALLTSVTIAKADLLAYEGFDYSTGGIGGKNGGDGWSIAWETTRQFSSGGSSVDDPGLTYNDGSNDLNVIGNHGVVDRTSRGAGRTFNATFDSGITWVSYLLQPGVDPNTEVIDLTVHTQLRMADGAVATNVGFDLTTDSTDNDNYRFNGTDIGISAFNNDTIMVVLRLDRGQVAVDDDSAYLFINPQIGVEPALGTAVASETNQVDGSFNFNDIEFLAPSGNSPAFDPQIRFDEIRVADDYPNVTGVPEPATLALLALGGLAICRRR